MAAGYYHVRREDGGKVACWGESGAGQSKPPSGTFQQVAAGWYHTCGLRTNGTVVCWGDDSDKPPLNPPSGTFKQVSSHYNHTCGIRTDDTVACWGVVSEGDTTPPGG